MKQLASSVLAALALCFASHANAEQVDLELVLAMDASGSISNAEYVLQLEGTAAAFRDPAIQAAITSGPAGKMAVSVMLWSDAAFPKIKSGRFVLDSARSADRFASLIAQADGITINGLPILSENFPALDQYYRNEVIVGPGALIEKTSGFEDFGPAIRRKLLREIQNQVAIVPRHLSQRVAGNRP